MKRIIQALFGKSFGFQPVDPLADGLGEAIELERRESEAIQLDGDDSDDIQRFWRRVERDIHGVDRVDSGS
ncbi:MAG: hypothetical protein Q4B05_02905 [Candidatus Saccharibacteria bacterium]|nr:hypothetical protein [Candidatus Saccharibacteria bacterium]